MNSRLGDVAAGATAEAAQLLTETAPRTRELFHELDHRRNDCIDVWLFWRPNDDVVFVEVADGRTDERFAVEVSHGERALDVFRHPYAYAALRGIETSGGRAR